MLRKYVRVHSGDSGKAATVSSTDVMVRDLVSIPYAYQSFNTTDLPSHVTKANYENVSQQYSIFVEERRASAFRQHSRDSLVEVLRSLPDNGFERLRALEQSVCFNTYAHDVLNFLEAVEYLHVHKLDSGFLQRVADAKAFGDEEDDDGNDNSRAGMMRHAYEHGWYRGGEVDDRLVVMLLVKLELVEVVHLPEEIEAVNRNNNDNNNDRKNDDDNDNHNEDDNEGDVSDNDHDDDDNDGDDDDDDNDFNYEDQNDEDPDNNDEPF
jgi:hypothetical protein